MASFFELVEKMGTTALQSLLGAETVKKARENAPAPTQTAAPAAPGQESSPEEIQRTAEAQSADAEMTEEDEAEPEALHMASRGRPKFTASLRRVIAYVKAKYPSIYKAYVLGHELNDGKERGHGEDHDHPSPYELEQGLRAELAAREPERAEDWLSGRLP